VQYLRHHVLEVVLLERGDLLAAVLFAEPFDVWLAASLRVSGV
jgi:hypothetical protein